MTQKRIALLATGDEIINGDILNTNAQQIAQSCFGEQITIGQHMVVADVEQELTQSINYLLQTHDALLTIGGLGPTCDDRTRFAIAKALNTPLNHDEDTWQHIQNRLTEFGLTAPESNKQQALFPQGATILPNPNGTACGCMIQHKINARNDKLIFMLPGPPKECLPMFNDHVLPVLLNRNFANKRFFHKWLLFMVSEGHIAQQTERLLEKYPSCDPAYRIAFPYLEVKLFTQQQKEFTEAIALLDNAFNESKFFDGNWRASDLLVNKLQETTVIISIKDEATGGLLEQQLTQPGLTSINFHQALNHSWLLKISGLKAYWNNKKNIRTCELAITLISPEDRIIKQNFQIPYRSDRTPLYAMEYCCKFLLEILFNIR